MNGQRQQNLKGEKYLNRNLYTPDIEKTPLNIPERLVKTIAVVGDVLGKKAPINSVKLKKIVSDLSFDDSKARKLLGWNPTPVLEGFKIL